MPYERPWKEKAGAAVPGDFAQLSEDLSLGRVKTQTERPWSKKGPKGKKRSCQVHQRIETVQHLPQCLYVCTHVRASVCVHVCAGAHAHLCESKDSVECHSLGAVYLVL